MWYVAVVVIGSLFLSPVSGVAQVSGVEHVVLVGIDGMSPEGLRNARTPRMDQLMNEGAFTMHARAVRPTSSSPNWSSMIMGAAPEQHGITSNNWRRNSFSITPVTTGLESLFPTIFGVLRQQQPDVYIAVIYDWGGISRLFEHSAVNLAFDSQGPQEAVNKARMVFAESKPTLTFIHLDHVDIAGHGYGWGSTEYYAAVEEADRYINEIIQGLSDAGMAEKTTLLVTSDHGGTGRGHGGDSMAEIEIPWIIHGHGTEKDVNIPQPVYIYDTAATIAAVLGLQQPYAWIGRPVKSAFEEGVLTAVEKPATMEAMPVQFYLSQSYPNPFNPQTQFTLEVTENQQIRVEIYDVQGRHMAQIYRGFMQAHQPYDLIFEAPGWASGNYLVQVIGETFTATRSVVLLK